MPVRPSFIGIFADAFSSDDLLISFVLHETRRRTTKAAAGVAIRRHRSSGGADAIPGRVQQKTERAREARCDEKPHP